MASAAWPVLQRGRPPGCRIRRERPGSPRRPAVRNTPARGPVRSPDASPALGCSAVARQTPGVRCGRRRAAVPRAECAARWEQLGRETPPGPEQKWTTQLAQKWTLAEAHIAPSVLVMSPLVTRPLLLRLVSVVAGAVGFYLPLAAVPLYADSVGTGTAAGMANAALLFATVSTELVTPRVVTLVGYRWALAAGLVLLGTPVLVLLTPAGATVSVVVAVNAVRGVGFAVSVVAGGALTAALIPAERRGEGLALVGLVGGVPGPAGPPAGHLGLGALGLRRGVRPHRARAARRDHDRARAACPRCCLRRVTRRSARAAACGAGPTRGGLRRLGVGRRCRGHFRALGRRQPRRLGGALPRCCCSPRPRPWRAGLPDASVTAVARRGCSSPAPPCRWSAWSRWLRPARDGWSLPAPQSSGPGSGAAERHPHLDVRACQRARVRHRQRDLERRLRPRHGSRRPGCRRPGRPPPGSAPPSSSSPSRCSPPSHWPVREARSAPRPDVDPDLVAVPVAA